MALKNIIVVGASAGGLDALRQLVAGLPIGLPASVFIVWHMSPDALGILPEVLDKLNVLPAAYGIDGEAIEEKRIYVAPPDRHLLIEDGHIRITRGPKENRFRPAVDPLFRSAAFAYGPRVVGAVLTGGLDDGAIGLWAIKRLGGITIVQDPSDAEIPSMPENALRHVNVDYTVTIKKMPALIAHLATEEEENGNAFQNEMDKTLLEKEIRTALLDETLERQTIRFGELSPFTCPECRGVLSSIREGGLLRFRCHTGHAYSADSLLTSMTEEMENGLWSALRALKEYVLLSNHMGDHLAEINDPRLAADYFNKAREAEKKMHLVWRALFKEESTTFSAKL